MATPGFAAAYAKFILRQYIEKNIAPQGDAVAGSLPSLPIPDLEDAPHAPASLPGRICIIGAGVAGLAVAMCLQAIDFYDFDILEASDRVGGRVYTQAIDSSPTDPHNYYDIGAMRIPQVPAMDSTFNMIKDVLEIGDKMVRYVYSQEHDLTPTMYLYKPKTPHAVDAAMEKFKRDIRSIVSAFQTNWNQAFDDYIMTDDGKGGIDSYSTREWLRARGNWTYDEIEAAETGETSTGLFDQAFSETIIDHCDFAGTLDPPKPWFRLEGGMSVLTDAMQASVAGRGTPAIRGEGVEVSLNQAVTAMTEKDDMITVESIDTVKKTPLPSREYIAVFNTTALGCLGRMDISGLGLDDATLTGIRTLSYDRATKVAIKFTSPWWLPFMKDQIGGVSSSDLPISNVVYPSWNDGKDAPAVLMVSYSWAQDATRMGSIVPDYSQPGVTPQKTDQVVTVCLQSLAKLWSNTPGAPTYEKLLEMYVSHHAFAWSHDPWTGGAFALFGPGQFKNVYPHFFETKCHGKFNICGEATSAHHAWISGALDSAYTTVMTWLSFWNRMRDMAVLKNSPLGGGKGLHPAEFDETYVNYAARISQGYESSK